ncbi:MAG TPA: phage holin family protein [Pirellulales bacterium]|nr:phage holin family protein [Pirellulales bacterium]
MDDDREPLFAGIKDETSRLKSDFAQLLRVRWQLGKLEVRTAAHSAKRLAAGAIIALLLVLVSLPVLVVALAHALDGVLHIAFAGWLAVFGFGMLLFAAALAWFRYQRFRAEFVGLEQSLEELREDVVWLEERLAGRRSDEQSEAPAG